MYATAPELIIRIGDVYAGLYTDADGGVMAAEIAADLAAAAAEIDGMIGMRYETPVTSVPALPLLKNWNLTLAEELSWVRSGKGDVPENVKNRVAHVRGLLGKIADGNMRLPGAQDSGSESPGGMLIARSEEPVFTRNQLEGY